MKADRLDLAVLLIVAFCLAGVAAVAFFSDPGRQPALVAYLYPATSAPHNVWLAEMQDPAAKRQLTFSDAGVYDFDISPDGRWLAYAERHSSGAVALRLLDIPAGRTRTLVDCVAIKALCTTPVFSPDGAKLAYQRSETASRGFGLPRIWLVSLLGADYDTVPLIADSQVLGHSPVWSGDSNTVAFYSADTTQPGILIFDFAPRGDDGVQLRFIPSSHGAMGALSPNGQQLIFPELVRRDGRFYTHLRIADLAARQFAAFTDPQGPTDDVAAQWSPDGDTVALARQYTDARWTPGHQLYLRRLSDETESLRAVAYDPRYNSSYFRWNRAGDALATQRFPLQSEGAAKPEVWAHDLRSGESRLLAADAFLPQWAGA